MTAPTPRDRAVTAFHLSLSRPRLTLAALAALAAASWALRKWAA